MYTSFYDFFHFLWIFTKFFYFLCQLCKTLSISFFHPIRCIRRPVSSIHSLLCYRLFPSLQGATWLLWTLDLLCCHWWVHFPLWSFFCSLEPKSFLLLSSHLLILLKYAFLWFPEKGSRDFPGGPVIKNPPCKAGEVQSLAGELRAHMLWQLLSPWAATYVETNKLQAETKTQHTQADK